jgi:hypothetical protein
MLENFQSKQLKESLAKSSRMIKNLIQYCTANFDLMRIFQWEIPSLPPTRKTKTIQ